MERAVEWFVAVTSLIVGCSHIFRATDWVEVFARLHRIGRPGAFINGGLSLVTGAIIVAGHPVWTWPGVALTVFGWLMVAKGAVCFLAPDKALRSMEDRSTRNGFIFAGVVLLVIAAWAFYCILRSAETRLIPQAAGDREATGKHGMARKNEELKLVL